MGLLQDILKAVSEQFISLAIFFMSSSVSFGANSVCPCLGIRGTTPAGFPPKGVSVKASSWKKGTFINFHLLCFSLYHLILVTLRFVTEL